MKICIAAGLAAFLPLAAHAAGDAEKGALVFKKCAACHSIDSQENKIGPYLTGVFGRKAASVQTFANYSSAMKKAGAEGMVWDETALEAYIGAPKKFLPGNRMTFTGLKSHDDVANVIEYLKTEK